MAGATETNGDTPASRGRCWWTVAAVGVFAVASVLLLRHQSSQTPLMKGDIWEYWYMAESLHRHGTPELRPEDRAAVDAESMRLYAWASPEHPYAYMATPDGKKWFGQHFWIYALSTVPAKAYLEWSGQSGLGGLGLANAAWFLLALAVTLFASSAPPAQRVALAGLAAAGPAVWYIAWPGAEMYSWSLVLMGVVAYRDRRYVWAGLAAGLAAMQNPPAIFLGGVAVLAALTERRWRVAFGAAVGTAAGLIPYAFFQYHFGIPNLIVTGAEYAGVRNLSLVRTYGLVTDFNQGLLPYLPVLVVAMIVGTARLVYTRNLRGLLLAAGGLGMAVGVQIAHNWNSGCYGLQRYLVWMLPVAAGVAVEGIGGTRRLWALAALAIVGHTAIQVAYDRTDALKGGELEHTPVAEWVLTHHPRAYWVEPEVFVERGQHRDGWPHVPADFPIGFARPDGTISKMLLGAAEVDRVPVRYEVTPEFLAELRERAGRERGLFYVHPPHGAVRVRPAPS